MADIAADPALRRQGFQSIQEIDVLWITAGLGCDGDTIAMTAATQPSLEDIVLGAMPWIPKVKFHNPFLAYENGDDFLKPFHLAAEGQTGSIHSRGRRIDPRRDKQGRRILGLVRHRCEDRPADHDVRMDRPTGAQGLGRYGGGHLRDLWRHSCHGRQSDRLHGACRIISVGNGNRRPDIPHRLHSGMSGPARQFHGNAALPAPHGRGPGADDSARRGAAADLAVRPDRPRGMRPRRILRAGASSPRSTVRALCIVKLGCWGPVVQCNVGKRGWMGGIGGCPNVGGICIGCTMPGFPDKFMPFMNQPPGSLLSSSAVMTYGRAIHALRRFTQASLNKEPSWRRRVSRHRLDGAVTMSCGRKIEDELWRGLAGRRDRRSGIRARGSRASVLSELHA